MKNFTQYILLTISILSVSCSDFLYQEPDDQVSIDEQFSTKEGLLQTVSGLYYSMEALVSSKYFVYADMLGGNATFVPTSQGYLQILSSVENSFDYDDEEDNSDYESFYQDCYDIVNQTNLILEHLYDADDVTDEERQQINSEVLAARGFSHFLASLLYSQNMNYTADGSHLGIVYNTRTLQAGVDYPSRLTKAETYSLIIADLEKSISLYTGSQVFDYGNSYSYFNPINVRALIARVALDNNDWELAYSASDSVILNSTVGLVTTDMYKQLWKSSDDFPETLLTFSAPTSDEGDVSSSVSNEYFYYTELISSIDTTENDTPGPDTTFQYSFKDQAFVASNDLRDLFADDDIRKDVYRPFSFTVILDGVENDSLFYFVEKYMEAGNTPFMRLSEMYLTRAEAAINLSEANIGSALSDLNIIRERAGLSNLVTGDITEFREELYEERRRELAFEGHLFFDHMRMQRDVTRGEDAYASSKGLNYPNPKFVLPIPESTLDVNEFMQQNESYY